MSSIANKIKEAIHQPHHSDPEGTHGPHNSRAANAADPRIDSDRDHRAQHTGVGSTTGGHNTDYTASDNYAYGSSNNPNSTYTAGPHKSDAMNKADPRVDSDRDGSRNMGMKQGQASYATGVTGSAPEGTYGPHHGRIANAADPRVDSDRDGSRNMGMENPAYQTNQASYTPSNAAFREDTYGARSAQAGTGTGTGTAVDPSLDSTQYTGPAPHTAGPHKKDMLNKLDPRVDSNQDGSRTIGSDKTYAQSSGSTRADASKVPPSVLREHLGDVEIHHDDPLHNRERRNSVATHQEKHVMGGI